ncbi:phage antirepressor N-terminal domain-containing protein [Vibrio splendidus]
MPSSQITVSFHGSNLIVIDQNGEPYTPMKNIVEGMGMDWSYQSRKLNSNKARWGVAVIAIPSIDPHNPVSCLPLRKLFGWLQTLQPNRVRADIKNAVIHYQNECDDVLWKHWSRQYSNVPEVIEPPKRLRLLLNMENGRVVSTQPVPFDAMVAAPSEIADRLKEPSSFTIEDYLEIAKVANEFPSLW